MSLCVWWWVVDDGQVVTNHFSSKVVYPFVREIRLYILKRRQESQFIHTNAGNVTVQENDTDVETIVENGRIQGTLDAKK